MPHLFDVVGWLEVLRQGGVKSPERLLATVFAVELGIIVLVLWWFW